MSLDRIRYADRTKENVSKALDKRSLQILAGLQKRKIVNLYKKDDNIYRYGISKSIYDKYLYGKRKSQQQNSQDTDQSDSTQQPKKWVLKLEERDAFTELLESQGYLVISNATDAERVSSMLEESIRMGLVLGTRAFNKKFYVALRSYINKYAPKIISFISESSKHVSEIAKEVGIDEDGARAILYIMSESGDVVERKKDHFKTA
ncbi:MAG: hypothetical protein QXN59_02740 [Candidatus Micrarchaeaceae archaeon]